MRDQIIEFYKIGEFEEFDKYLIVRSTNAAGRPILQIYNTNVKKIFKARVQGYYFRTEEQREEHIKEFKKYKQEQIDWKNQRKAKRASFVNPAKVGDILYDSWGYEQTNIDFYQVLEVNGKSVLIRELAQNREYEGSDRGTTKPIKEKFVGSAVLKRVSPSYNDNDYTVSMASYSCCSLWDGQPKYWSSYA